MFTNSNDKGIHHNTRHTQVQTTRVYIITQTETYTSTDNLSIHQSSKGVHGTNNGGTHQHTRACTD